MGYFKKAESLYREIVPQVAETPMYEWCKDTRVDDWCFKFLDSEGMGWKITILQKAESEEEEEEYCVDTETGLEAISFWPRVCYFGNLDKLKSFALRKAMYYFPRWKSPKKD